MATYRATGPTSYKRHDRDSGAGVMVLALFLGIAVGVLVIVAAVLIKIADDARDDVNATATAAPATHDHSTASSAVSLPLQSFAGVTGENAEELATAHAATNAALPPVPATLENIMEEKYVTLFLNIEAWNDYKRTCLPALAPAPASLGSTTPGTNPVPGRLPYGITEINANPHTPAASPVGRNPNDPNPCPVLDYSASTPLGN